MKFRSIYTWCVGLGFGFSMQICADAVPQSAEQAAKAVSGWLTLTRQPLGAAMNSLAGQTTPFRNTNGATLYYVVSLKPEGYVVTAPDDELEPIIAFSPNGVFQPDPGNPLFALVERDLPQRLQRVRGPQLSSLTSDSAQSKWARLTQAASGTIKYGLGAVDDVRVAPFIESRWNQSTIWTGSSSVACYNYYTPPYAPGSTANYVCGCNNTAWAQIMRYYKYPTQPVGTGTFTIRVDDVPQSRQLRGGDGLGGPYSWNSMPLVPGIGTTVQQCQAIGALTADIGVASETYYASSGSGAWSDEDTLKNVFFYQNIIYGGGTGPLFATQVHPNLDARLPIYLSISGPTAAHAVVCDGYGYNTGTLYHHLNMGWSGGSDAWYNLPIVEAGYYFDTVGGFYYNIYTNGSGEIISGRITDTGNFAIADAAVQVTAGGQSWSGQSDSHGIFAFARVPSDTTFVVTVAKAGYQFAPRTVTTGHSGTFSPPGNKWGINFVGVQNQNVRIVCGVVSGNDGVGLPGIAVSFSNGGPTVTTDSSGGYFGTVPVGWSGTVTPALAQYAFAPVSRSYANLTSNQGSQDFIGARVLYVNALATGLNNGSSWANAFTSLQAGIDNGLAGNEIWVAQGTYYPGTSRTNSFQCKAGVNVFGGFAGTETARTQRDWTSRVTTLSGDIGVPGTKTDNSYHVVKGANNAILDGFTITAGAADTGYPDNVGGGILGGWDTSSFTVSNCRIIGNSASSLAGAAYLAGTLQNCLVLSNSSQYGPAYQTLLRNCLVQGNSANVYGGGGYYTTNFNCTIVGNNAGIYGGGLYASVATNCVIYNNTAYAEPNHSGSTLGYCCTTPLPPGEGNFTNNPGFCDAARGDYRLAPQSPAINKGLNLPWMTGGLDLAGQSRISGGIVDVGAYETDLNQPCLASTPSSLTFAGLATAPPMTQSLELWNAGAGTVWYSLSTNAAWLSVSPVSGSSTGEHDVVTVRVSPAGLAPGNYAALITFSATNCLFTQQSVPVSLTVIPDLNTALDTTGLNWVCSGNSEWVIQSSVTHDGMDAARSGTITHDQQSIIETTVQGPVALSFWWKVSSESSYDFLRVSVNGIEQLKISGEVGWQRITGNLPSGPQTVRWSYTKDNIVSAGQDCAWLDEVIFVGPPLMLNPKRTGTVFTVSVLTAGGKTYYLEYKNALSDSTWTSLPGVAGDWTVKPLSDPNASGTKRFYRVRQE